MIRRTLLRLTSAAGLGVLGAGLAASGGGSALGYVLFAIGGLWGIAELFILAALLFTYGVTGISHDIGEAQDRDPWNRW